MVYRNTKGNASIFLVRPSVWLWLLVFFGWLLPYPCLGADNVTESVASAEELLDLSFEELMDVEITSVSKKEQKAFKAPAAVYVLTEEDIRRSGATSVPEVLRLVPGVQNDFHDGGPKLSADRLTLYLHSDRAQGDRWHK